MRSTQSIRMLYNTRIAEHRDHCKWTRMRFAATEEQTVNRKIVERESLFCSRCCALRPLWRQTGLRHRALHCLASHHCLNVRMTEPSALNRILSGIRLTLSLPLFHLFHWNAFHMQSTFNAETVSKCNLLTKQNAKCNFPSVAVVLIYVNSWFNYKQTIEMPVCPACHSTQTANMCSFFRHAMAFSPISHDSVGQSVSRRSHEIALLARPTKRKCEILDFCVSHLFHCLGSGGNQTFAQPKRNETK